MNAKVIYMKAEESHHVPILLPKFKYWWQFIDSHQQEFLFMMCTIVHDDTRS